MRRLILAGLATISFASIGETNLDQTMSMSVPTSTTHKIGVGLEPLYLLIGGLGAKVDTRLTDTMSIGLQGMYVPKRAGLEASDSAAGKAPSYKFSAYDLRIGPTFFLTGLYDTNGWYVTPAIGRMGISVTEWNSLGYSGTLDAWQASVTAGYQWVTSENLRLTAGGGLRMLTKSDIVIKDGAGDEIHREKAQALSGLALDLQISYMF